tara:strand:+ start:73 stop:1398 length:1326 start_codon:yes stop_codon:yes gene_type:complete
MAKRTKNEDKLCTGFYQAHDFLNFDLKKYRSNVKPLMDINRLGINMAPPELVDGPYSKEQEAAYNVLNWYAQSTHEEYDRWLDSLKFQYKHSILHELLPPKQILNEFFGDLHVRVPHEKTLLINKCGDKTTCIVSVEEVNAAAWFVKMKKMLGVKILQPHPFKEIQKQVSAWKSETILLCRITVNTHVPTEEIYKPKRFSKKVLECLTRPKTFHYPITFVLPCGGRISNLDAIRTPVLIHDVNALEPNGEYPWFQTLLQPASTPPIEGQYLQWDDNSSLKQNFQYHSGRIKKMIKSAEQEGYKDPMSALWQLVCQNIIHISVLTHPDFKDFCVNLLQNKGLQPHKHPYNSKNPYKSRPGWRPPFEHYVVTINVPDDVSLEENSSVHKKRHHLVRGHLMRSKGKNAIDGFVWRKSHWRGNKELGTVTKDYVMNVDEKIKKAI